VKKLAFFSSNKKRQKNANEGSAGGNLFLGGCEDLLSRKQKKLRDHEQQLEACAAQVRRSRRSRRMMMRMRMRRRRRRRRKSGHKTLLRLRLVKVIRCCQ
jgi:hypothetical protein